MPIHSEGVIWITGDLHICRQQEYNNITYVRLYTKWLPMNKIMFQPLLHIHTLKGMKTIRNHIFKRGRHGCTETINGTSYCFFISFFVSDTFVAGLQVSFSYRDMRFHLTLFNLHAHRKLIQWHRNHGS